MSRVEIPEWVTRMLSPGGEPVRLSDEDFVKFDSFVPERFQRFIVFPNSPDAKEIERYNTLVTRLVVLRDYNRKLRANAVMVGGSQPPTTVEEAEAQGYVEAKVITTLFHSTFSSSSALTKYLDSDEHKDSIRRFKPFPNRRWVHAADLLKTLFDEETTAADALAKLQGEKKNRRNKTGK